MDVWGCFGAKTERFDPFATEEAQCQNWTVHHQLCLRLHVVLCFNVSYMCFVDVCVCVCGWLRWSARGGRIGREGVVEWAGQPSRRTRRNPHGGVGGEAAAGLHSESAPWASTTRVGSEMRPAEGSHRDWASGLCRRRRRRCDCSRPPRRRAQTRRPIAAGPPAPRTCSGAHPRRLCAVAPSGSSAATGAAPQPRAPPRATSQRPRRRQVRRPNPRRRASPLAVERGMGAAMEPCEGGRAGTTKGRAAAAATQPRNRVPFPRWARGHRARPVCIRG